jgi:hypothetical protein
MIGKCSSSVLLERNVSGKSRPYPRVLHCSKGGGECTSNSRVLLTIVPGREVPRLSVIAREKLFLSIAAGDCQANRRFDPLDELKN